MLLRRGSQHLYVQGVAHLLATGTCIGGKHAGCSGTCVAGGVSSPRGGLYTATKMPQNAGTPPAVRRCGQVAPHLTLVEHAEQVEQVLDAFSVDAGDDVTLQHVHKYGEWEGSGS